MFCVGQKRSATSRHWDLPFSHMKPGFFILISLLLDSGPRKLHGRQSKDFMEEIPAPKRARRAIGTVCVACGKVIGRPCR